MALFNNLHFSSAILVLTNFFPLLAVYIFDWTVFQVVFLYWLELGVVGFINIFKIAIAEGPKRPENRRLFNSLYGQSFDKLSKGALIVLFPIHYSLFLLML